MSITNTLQKFMDDTYTAPCWDDFTVLNEYVAVSDDLVAADLEDWMLEKGIPFCKMHNRSTGTTLLQIIDKVF